ncbi:hypothetical protein O9G_005992 [Rozella allomycis CSF55]|uniref:Uncharacterized protein n=1 Tax=Rozella allomycis (strain CSF55) TaxID=988480 RepID=A0A075B1L7_ROZAC|nr:hypothetical protein O9G_005992 [Rozella allomycis CSF55]|eukprot:EPZ36433.1 hypothetical protein O9G_005992 [Rozella allomycis CSF55]
MPKHSAQDQAITKALGPNLYSYGNSEISDSVGAATPTLGILKRPSKVWVLPEYYCLNEKRCVFKCHPEKDQNIAFCLIVKNGFNQNEAYFYEILKESRFIPKLGAIF